jgi:hypothetical protein
MKLGRTGVAAQIYVLVRSPCEQAVSQITEFLVIIIWFWHNSKKSITLYSQCCRKSTATHTEIASLSCKELTLTKHTPFTKYMQCLCTAATTLLVAIVCFVTHYYLHFTLLHKVYLWRWVVGTKYNLLWVEMYFWYNLNDLFYGLCF